jgi:mono/diheme cytochrome c family protein
MKKFPVKLGLVSLITIAFSFTLQQEDPWKVPKSYETLKNPVTADKASVLAGKEIFNTYCPSCHGTDGKGNGKRSVNLNKTPSDFTSETFQNQTDGALLYKIYFGHKEMPGFKKRIPDAEAVMHGNFGKTRNPGDLINYMRTFAKK